MDETNKLMMMIQGYPGNASMQENSKKQLTCGKCMVYETGGNLQVNNGDSRLHWQLSVGENVNKLLL